MLQKTRVVRLAVCLVEVFGKKSVDNRSITLVFKVEFKKGVGIDHNYKR